MRSTLPALVVATILVACNSFQSPPVPAFDHDPADTEQADAPPSENELANSGVIDVTVPAPVSGEGSDSERHMGVAASASAPVVVYVNGKGGTYYAGNDNAAAHTSSILSYYGRQSAVLPAAGYQGAQWQQLLDCMRGIYTPYNVTITDQKPAAGTYTEIVVTNTWASSAMGISNAIGGIAPLGQCRTVPSAIGYVFEAIYDTPGYGGVRGACESASHELGHTLSLSHEQLSTDLMSYAPANANKKFQDQASACGVSTSAPEACTCGAATQSSNRQLLSIVGAAGTGGGGTTNPGDTTAPKISIVSPANDSSQPGNANVVITVDATDETSLSDVRLVWQYTNATLACDASISGVTCDHTGNRYTWTVFAGTGDRSFYAYAVDGGGNKASTTLSTIHLTGGTTTTDAPPTISLQYPANNTAIARGGDVIFQAAVSDDIGISDVRATWYYDGGSLQYPMTLTSTAGVYQARTTVSASATPGWRTVEIEATDTKAQRTLSQRVNVYVQ